MYVYPVLENIKALTSAMNKEDNIYFSHITEGVIIFLEGILDVKIISFNFFLISQIFLG